MVIMFFCKAGTDKDSGVQIFTSRAASGILTNDLIKIMENEQVIFAEYHLAYHV